MIRKISIILVSLFSSISAFTQIGATTSSLQSSVPGVIETRFLRDSMVLDEKGFAFNSLTLKNLTSSPLEVVIVADLKEKIQSVNPIPQNIVLAPNEVKVLPLRFTLTGGGVVSGVFLTRFNFSLPGLLKSFYNEFSVRVQKNTKWRSAVDKASIIFKGVETSLPFHVTIDNRGNSEEVYEIEVQSAEAIKVKGQTKSISIPAGQSKIIEYFIENASGKERPININNSTVEIYVRNIGGDTRKYNLELIRLGNIYTENISAWKRMPLTLELNGYNIGNPSAYGFGRVYGNLDLNSDQHLRVYYQSDNYFRGGKSNSLIGFAEYESKKFKIHAGSIQEFNNFQVDGFGLRLGFKGRRSTTDIYYAKGRNERNEVGGISNVYYFGKRWSNTFKSVYYDDKINFLKSAIAENEIGYAINSKTQFAVSGGYSAEQTGRKFTPEQQFGQYIGYNLQHNGDKVQYTSTVKYYSDAYAGFNKGFRYQQHKIRFQRKKSYIQLMGDLNYRRQNNYTEFGLDNYFNQDSKSGGVTFGWFDEKYSFSIGPSYVTIKQDSINSFAAQSGLVNLNVFYAMGQSTFFSLVSQTGITKVPQNLFAKNIFVTSNFGSISSKFFGVQYRFDHGPIFYYEVSQYVQNPTLNTTRYQVSPYADLNFTKLHLSSRVQYTMNREFISDSKDDYVFYQLQWQHPKSKWEVFINGQYNLINKERSFLNLTYRRQLNVPVARNKKIRSGNFVFFKDINNNGTYDAGDQLLSDMQLTANKSLMLSDSKGSIQTSNTDDETIEFDFTGSNNTQGWIPLNGLKQTFTLTAKNNTQYVAFKKGKLLKGTIMLVKDANSTLDFSVSNIRVTAVNEQGVKYTAISDEKGEFYFNVVSGSYVVSLPQVFDEVFRPTEFAKTADLVLNETVNLTFEVRQKKRNVNIKKN